MPGEEMRLSVDFQTQRAAQASATLIQQLDIIALKESNAQSAAAGVTTGMNQQATSVGTAAQKWQGLGREIDKTKDVAQNAKQQFQALDTAQNSLAQSALNWVRSYAGLRGVLLLIQQIQQASRELEEIQKRAAQERLTQDQALANVMRNLGLEGVAGQTQARTLVSNLQTQAQLPFQTAARLLDVAQSVGMAPMARPAATVELGRFAGMAGIEGEDLWGIGRLLSQRGIQQNPQAIRGFLSKLYTAAQATGADVGTFTRIATGNLSLALERGMGLEESLSTLSAFVTTAPTPEAGGERFRMALTMSDAATPKLQQFVAQRAIARGFIHPAAVTQADLEAMAARGDEDAKGKLERYRDMGDTLTVQQRELSDAESDWAAVQASPKFMRLPIEQQNKARREAEEGLADRRRNLKERSEDRQRLITAATAAEQQKRNVEAMRQLPIGRTLQLYQDVFTGGDTEQMRQISEEMGGRPEMVNALRAASTAGFRQRQADVSGALQRPVDLQRAYDRYAELNVAGAQRMQSARDIATGRNTDIGETFAESLSATAEAELSLWQRKATGLERFSAVQPRAQAWRRVAMDQIRAFYSQLTPAERSKYGGQFAEMIQQVQDAGQVVEIDETGTVNQIKTILARLGNLREEIHRARDAQGDNRRIMEEAPGNYGAQLFEDFEGETRDIIRPYQAGQPGAYQPRNPAIQVPSGPAVPAAPGPAGAPAPSGGAAGGGQPVSYNISIGSYFSTDGANAEFEGRLEGIG